MSRETYAQARTRLLAELRARGWTTRPALQRPWAEKDGHRFTFTAQAVYYGAHSTFLDMREMDAGYLEEWVRTVERSERAVQS